MGRLEGLDVVRSKIHGYGVVARRPFKKGDILCYGDGVLWRDADEFDDTYALLVPGYERAADGSEGPPLFWDLADQTRWINHSCEPNTEVDTRWDAAEGTVIAWWYALRDIAPGEELAYDYGFAAEVAEPCACGVPTCRGVIVDDDPEDLRALAPELRARLRADLALIAAGGPAPAPAAVAATPARAPEPRP